MALSVPVWKDEPPTIERRFGMADQATIDALASKFQAWAEGLSSDEQTALAEWIADLAGIDVSAHWEANWWQQPGAWSRTWTKTWTAA
jgi:hypothetical protein